jgi:MarR family transcriptional regulator, organic hydroperoxide resistance regulator
VAELPANPPVRTPRSPVRPKRAIAPGPAPAPDDELLTSATNRLLAVFHGMPRQVPPAPARDITLGQLRLLFLIRRDGPQPMGRIGEVFDLTPAAATGFVDRIERHGLVERRHRSDDRRVVETTLTENGRHFLEELSGIRIDTIRRAISALQRSDLAEFDRLLGIIRDHQEPSS